MITLRVEKRAALRKKLLGLRSKKRIPAVLYGPKVQTTPLQVDQKDFEKAYQQAGETSLLNLELEGKQVPVLIHDIQKHPIDEEILHIDFYQPPLDKKVDIMVPLVFEGQAPAVKELQGTLIEQMREIEVSALPQDIPHEISVSLEKLQIFEDRILVGDLKLPQGVTTKRNAEEVIARVVPAEDVEKELETPMEEKVEEVELVEKAKKEKEKEEEEEGEESAKEHA